MINLKLARAYCSEDVSLVENYREAVSDQSQTWTIHHRAELLPCGRFSAEDLKRFGLYWKRPAAELVFMTRSAHNSLHWKGRRWEDGKHPWLGRSHSAETKAKLKIAARNRPPVSPETRAKMSESRKGHFVSDETKAKISASNKSGLPETRAKISQSRLGRKWFNDGETEVCLYECPAGFKPGRIKKKAEARASAF